MRYPVRFWTCCMAAAALMLGARGSLADDKLNQRMEELLSAPHYKHAHWGLLVMDMESGETVYELNADKLFAPASTTKLYSVAAALDALGADYRFETPIYRRGKLTEGGELDGDLILVASGDLTMGGRTTALGEIAFTNWDHTYANGNDEATLTEPDPLAGLNELARQVAAAGIRRVRGDVLIDDRLFDKDTSTGSGPSQLTPILVNDNLIDFVIEPTEPGQPAKVTWRPQTAAFRIDVKMQTVAKDRPLETWIRDLGQGRVLLHGTIPAGHKPLVRVYEVPDAVAFARSLLIEALQRAGVTVGASPLADHPHTPLPERGEYESMPVVAKLVSPPFSESARLILKVSHNLHASTLPLLVAAKNDKRTLSDGLRLQHDFLVRVGVDADTISFGGGAGGARADYVTPRATVTLLRYMTTRPDFDVYHRALPSLGVDGTLATVVSAGSSARGQIHAKTGTLSWSNLMNGGQLLSSKALAGYMTTSRGRKLTFALFVNHAHLRGDINTKRIGSDLGRLCEIIYDER